MARDFAKNTGYYMRLGVNALNPLVSGASAVSMAAWVHLDSASAAANDNRVFTAFVNGSSAGLMLAIDRPSGTNRVRAAGRSAAADGFQAVSGTTQDIAYSQWNHIGGVLNIAADTITPYGLGVADNGGAVTFGAATYTPGTGSGYDAVGSDGVPNGSTQLDGRVAELAIWTADIGADNCAALADGWSPSLIRPDALVFYMPLIGYASPEIDVVSGLAGTITGTIDKADHPRIIYSRRYRIFVPAGAAGPTYTLACDPGAFTVTGTDATLTAARTISADAGSFALTGTDAALTVARTLACDAGSYSLTGTDAGLTVSRTLACDPGSFAVTGTDAALTVARMLALDPGSYTLTGTDATLTYSPAGGYTLDCDPGTFSLTGTDATLTVARTLVLDPGTFTLTGTDAALLRGFTLDAEAGSYSLTGTDAALLVSRQLAADAGSYVLTGTAATLTYSGGTPDAPSMAWAAPDIPRVWAAPDIPRDWTP